MRLNKQRLPSTETLDSCFLFVLLLFSYAYFFPRWADPNQNSRLNMIVAIVNDGTFQIDKYVSNTVDYAKVGDHYYSDKAPGAAFAGVPVYWVLNAALRLPVLEPLVTRLQANPAFEATLNPTGSGILLEKIQFALGQVAVTLAVAAVPTAILGMLIFRYLTVFTNHRWLRLVVALTYALLTPAFTYGGAFYGHQLSAALLFGGFYLVSTPLKVPFSAGRLILVGFLLAYSVVTEYPAALIAGIIGLYAAYRLYNHGGLGRLAWIALGGAPVVLAWMAYNQAVFGGPLNLGYGYSELWVEQHNTGFMSLTLPSWQAAWGITFSPFRGLFFYSPVLLLALPGFGLWWLSGKYRAEFLVALTSVVAIFLFNASSGMWWGGFAVGPRYILLMLPFMALALVFPLLKWGGKIWLWVVYSLLAAWSLVATWGLTLAGQAYPSDTLRNPLLEYALPNWLAGNIARNIGTIMGINGGWSIVAWIILLLFILLIRLSFIDEV
jgi:hypothetical protein